MEMHHFTLRVSAELWKEFSRFAAADGETNTTAIRRLMRTYCRSQLANKRFCVSGEFCALALVQGVGSGLESHFTGQTP